MLEGVGLDLGTLAIGITGDNSDWIRKQRQTARQVAELDRSTATVDAKMDTRQMARGIAKSEGMLGRFASRGKMILATMFIGLATAVTALAGRWLKGAVTAASDAEEAINKFRVTFGEIPDEADAAAKAFSKSFGVASSTAKVLLGDTGDLLTGFGFAGSAALDLSKRTNELAADLASFTNIEGGTTRASKALTKALLGERESVKELGIAILEEDVKKQVALDRANGVTYATERQAKAYATLTIALSQSKNAIGDYARTQGGLANTLRRTAERFKELKEMVGKFMIDIFDLEAKAREWDSFIEGLVEGYEEWRDTMLDTIVFAMKVWSVFTVGFHNIKTFLFEGADHWMTYGKWVWSTAKTLWNNLGAVADAYWADMLAGYENQLKAVKGLYDNMYNMASATFSGMWKVAKVYADALVDTFTAIGTSLWEFIKDPFGGIDFSDVSFDIKGVTNAVFEAGAEVTKALQEFIDKPLGDADLGSFFDNLAKLAMELGIEPPDFLDWADQYKSFAEGQAEADRWAAGLREKWAADKAARDAARSGNREKEEDKAMAKRIHAGALERGTQAAFKAAQRPGVDPQKQIEKNTKETAENSRAQLAEQKKTNDKLENAPVLAPAGL